MIKKIVALYLYIHLVTCVVVADGPKLDRLQEQLSNALSRVSALESWKEQQQINTDRFYQFNWVNIETRLMAMEKKLQIAKEQLSEAKQLFSTQIAEIKSIFQIFSALSTLILLLTPFLLNFLNTRRRNGDPLRQNIDYLIQEIERSRQAHER